MPTKTPEGDNIRFVGQVTGFHYDIVKKNEAEFKLWLKEKLERYIFNAEELEVIKDILGITSLEARVLAVENK